MFISLRYIFMSADNYSSPSEGVNLNYKSPHIDEEVSIFANIEMNFYLKVYVTLHIFLLIRHQTPVVGRKACNTIITMTSNR